MSDQGNDWSRAPRPARATVVGTSPRATMVGTPPPPPLATTTTPPPTTSAAATPPPPPPILEPANVSVAELEVETPPPRRSRRAVGLALAGAAAVIALGVGLVVGLRPARHAPPPKAPAAEPVVVPLPPPAPVMPAAPPADEVALDPGVRARPPAPEVAAPPAARAASTEDAPRAHRRRATAHERRRATPKRKLAKNLKPTGDRAAAHAAYQRGNGLLLTGNAAGAADAYQEAVRLAPSDPAGYRGLGLAYEKEGRVKDAIAALVSYLKLSRHARDREVVARRLYRLTHPE